MKYFSFLKTSLLAAILALTLSPQNNLSAQMLETVDMSVSTLTANTYLTGINNNGYLTGYYSLLGTDYGFIITPSGKRLVITPSVLNATGTKVESINDNNVAVLTARIGSIDSTYKCYLNTADDTISHFVHVTGLTQSSSLPFDINNNNDISGWMQAATRFLFVKHDSIIPLGNSAYESSRYQGTYNTLAGGINDANKVVGFYINGNLNEPFVYDNLAGTYDTLSITNKTKLWDINNNNWVAGEYQQNNGVWMSFISDVSTGNFTQFTSLGFLFNDTSIQSVANAINDNGDVVGSFYHPDSNVWVGFVYHPGASEARIPGFSFGDDTWSLHNAPTVSNTSWPSTYWSGFDYTVTDPYVPSGTPLFDSYLQALYPGFTIGNDWSVDWLSFAKETDNWGFGGTTNPFTQVYYHSIAKHFMFTKYKAKVHSYYGNCYGITYSELLRYFDESLFDNWYGVATGTNTYQISNSDDNAIQSIARNLLKQNDVNTFSKYATETGFDKESMWSGLHEMKTEFAKPFAQSNPRGLSYKIPAGFHSVLPYKIRTPRKFPFDSPTMQYDTIFIHDSNEPGDSTLYILAGAHRYYLPHTEVIYTGSPVEYISLNKLSVRELMTMPMTQLKSTSAGDDPLLALSTDGPSYYTISTGTGQATLDGSGYTNTATDLTKVQFEAELIPEPIDHVIDTALTASIHSYNYSNSAMIWTQSNKRFSMGISRTAVSTEADNGEAALRRFSYGNPDNTTKYLNCSFAEVEDNLAYGSNIMATGVCAAQGDSIVTASYAPYTYTITKVNGTTNCSYDLTVFAAYNSDTVKEFHTQIELNGNTTHTIDPYFQGTNGTQIAVIVDDGNDGTVDDTLFVTGWPVGVSNIINKDGIKVYPNPVSNELNIELAAAQGNYTISLTDIVGRVVYTTTVAGNAGKTQVQMAPYPTGVYLLQVADGKGHTILKDKIMRQ